MITTRSAHWTHLATLSVGVFLLTGCGGDSPTSSSDPPVEAEVFSYEAVLGDWAGELEASGVTYWTEASVTVESVTRGTVVGTNLWFNDKGGSLICDLELLAEDSNPPIYRFKYNVRGGAGGCGEGGTVRWEYDAAAETVTSFFQAEGSSNWIEHGPLTRPQG
jgi:hypothetical protein